MFTSVALRSYHVNVKDWATQAMRAARFRFRKPSEMTAYTKAARHAGQAGHLSNGDGTKPLLYWGDVRAIL